MISLEELENLPAGYLLSCLNYVTRHTICNFAEDAYCDEKRESPFKRRERFNFARKNGRVG